MKVITSSKVDRPFGQPYNAANQSMPGGAYDDQSVNHQNLNLTGTGPGTFLPHNLPLMGGGSGKENGPS